MRERGARKIEGLMVAAGILAAGAYFAHHALVGANGIAALGEIDARRAEARARLAALAEERGRLEREVELLADAHVDEDFLDERVRATFGYALPGEIVLFKDGPRGVIAPARPPAPLAPGTGVTAAGGEGTPLAPRAKPPR